MSLYKNLILIYGILPYILNISNKWEFMISILFGNAQIIMKYIGNARINAEEKKVFKYSI